MKRNQPIELSGAHALITGAARGIGFATARRLVRSGARVTLWDLDADALKQASEELAAEHAGARITTEALDITEWATLADALGRSTSQLGPIDILINNAGHLAPGRLEDQAPETWMKTIEVNVQAVIYLSRLVVPSMYARRRGHIVNISSAAGTIGVPKLAVYSASKWAVWGFSEALRGEASHHGVHVSSIHPGYIAHGMFAGARLRGIGRLIVPLLRSHDVVAEAIVESALRRGETSPKRPRSVGLAVFLRGVLPDRWFNGLIGYLGVRESMNSWHGRD